MFFFFFFVSECDHKKQLHGLIRAEYSLRNYFTGLHESSMYKNMVNICFSLRARTFMGLVILLDRYKQMLYLFNNYIDSKILLEPYKASQQIDLHGSGKIF